MRLHLPIRARLALVTTVLAAAVLAAGLLSVYLIEAHQVHQRLVADARTAAHDLAIVGVHPSGSGGGTAGAGRSTPSRRRPPAGGRPPAVTVPPPVTEGTDTESAATDGSASRDAGGVPATTRAVEVAFTLRAPPPAGPSDDDAAEDRALATYLGARRGSSQLLVYVPPHGAAIANRSLAIRLVQQRPPIGGVRTVNLEGDGYVVAAAARGRGGVLAGVPVAEADAAVRRLLDVMLVVGVIALGPVTVGAWLVARRALSPLSRIAQRASQVTAGDLSVRMGPVTTRDEIGEVATAIDAMLDRLEAAFSAQRRFVNDASHELRTPLTIARGHLEVALPSVNGSDELRRAVDVAIAELDRMGLLVDSLLRLAHAGEGGRGDRCEVDLGAVARAAVDRCRVLGERSWQVETSAAPVTGDEAALEQVVVNLLSNAVRHTSPGDTITVAATTGDDRVEVRVADTGEGVDPVLAPSLFDRFTRADGARSRDTGGAGLGLAICHAIVTAHGGTITASATPGGGATFTVSLPRRDTMRAVSEPAHGRLTSPP